MHACENFFPINSFTVMTPEIKSTVTVVIFQENNNFIYIGRESFSEGKDTRNMKFDGRVT